MKNKSLTTKQLGWLSIVGIVVGGLLGGFIGAVIQMFLGMLLGLFWFIQALREKNSSKGRVILKLVAGVILIAVVNALTGGFGEI